MFKSFLFFIIFLLAPIFAFTADSPHDFVNKAKIVLSFDDIAQDFTHPITGTRIFLMDLDFTMVRPVYSLIHFPAEAQTKILQAAYEKDPRISSISRDVVGKFAHYIGSLQAEENLPMLCQNVVIEKSMHDFFARQFAQGAIFIGLTARPLSSARATDEEMRNLGFDFVKFSRTNEIGEYFPDATALYQGIFYTGNRITKAVAGERIVTILTNKSSLEGPLEIAFVDDNADEIRSFFIHRFDCQKFSLTPYYKPFNYHHALVTEFFLPWHHAQTSDEEKHK